MQMTDRDTISKGEICDFSLLLVVGGGGAFFVIRSIAVDLRDIYYLIWFLKAAIKFENIVSCKTNGSW